MRILFTSSIYPRSYAPVRGIYCQSLCRALRDEHDVRVVSPVSWLERFRQRKLFAAGKVAPNDHVPVEYPWYFYPPKLMRSWYGRFMWRSVRRAVRNTCKTFKPDCVLSYWLHPDGEVAVRAARELGVPSAVIVGGSDALLLPRDPSRRKSIEWVLAEADAFITVSQGLKDKLVELGADASKVHVIYQGIDRDLFRPGNRLEARERLGLPAGQKSLLWVGGMVPVKALDVLLDACALLRQRGTDFHLYLVGDGPLRQPLTAKAAAQGLANTVTFVGSRSPHQLPDWYRAADLTVLSSLSEGIPNVLRESLACGTPFVATRVGDIAEFCPETADELVPAGNAAALADAIARSLAGQAGQPSLSRLTTWDEYADEVAGLLEQLTPTPRGASAGVDIPHAVAR